MTYHWTPVWNHQVVQIKQGPIQTNFCSQASTINESHVSRWVFQLLFLLDCRDKGWQSSKYFFNGLLWALIMRWAGPQFPSFYVYFCISVLLHLPLWICPCALRGQTIHVSYELCATSSLYVPERKREPINLWINLPWSHIIPPYVASSITTLILIWYLETCPSFPYLKVK